MYQFYSSHYRMSTIIKNNPPRFLAPPGERIKVRGNTGLFRCFHPHLASPLKGEEYQVDSGLRQNDKAKIGLGSKIPLNPPLRKGERKKKEGA